MNLYTQVETPDRKVYYILIDEENGYYVIDERFMPSNWKRETTFTNSKEMSAYLRDVLGYTWACEVLFKNNVPKDDLLWSLNHTGYPKNDEFLTMLNDLKVND